MNDKPANATEALRELVACDDEAQRIEDEGKVPEWDGLIARHSSQRENAIAALRDGPSRHLRWRLRMRLPYQERWKGIAR